MSNPLQMNDWNIGKFLTVLLAIQLSMWSTIALDAIGLQIPILRQLIGFIYLTFIPGILILRILKLHKLGNIKTLLYAVGLSLAALMFTGFFMNILYPSFGISRPISLIPLIITISAIVSILCVLCYLRDKDFEDPSFVDLEEVLSAPVLFLCITPFMAVLGTYLVNFYHLNILLMLMIIVIALVSLLIGFDMFIPVRLYPLAIWTTAISMIWHNTLISMYLNIYDVYYEYYIANLITNNQIWNYNMQSPTNSMLSISILAPLFHYILNIDLVWVFKIIYPLVFSLTPVGLYSIFKERVNNKVAFFSCFLFISVRSFYTFISSTTKQSTAELFLILLLMLILNTKMNKPENKLLSIVFAAALITSHYGTSYLVGFSFIFVLFFVYLTETQISKNLYRMFYFTVSKKELNASDSNLQRTKIIPNYIVLFIIIEFAWYIYISNASTLSAFVYNVNQILGNIFTDFLNPETSRGMYTLTKAPPSYLRSIYKGFNTIIPVFITIGLFKLLLKHREMKFEREYVFFSVYWYIILLCAISISYFAVMNDARLYHLGLIFLAPLSIIGIVTIFDYVINLFKIPWTRSIRTKRLVNLLTIFFTINFLLNSGFIFEIADDYPNSISLSQENMIHYKDIQIKALYYTEYMPEQDVFSSRWLAVKREEDKQIYATYGWGQGAAALNAYGMISQQVLSLNNMTKTCAGDYIYLLYVNVVEGIGLDTNSELGIPIYLNMTDIYPLLAEKDKIYDNGGSNILWS